MPCMAHHLLAHARALRCTIDAHAGPSLSVNSLEYHQVPFCISHRHVRTCMRATHVFWYSLDSPSTGSCA